MNDRYNFFITVKKGQPCKLYFSALATSISETRRRYTHICISRPLRTLLHALQERHRPFERSFASPSNDVHIQTRFDEPAGKMISDAAGERCRLDRGQGSSRSFDHVDRIGPSLYIINRPILPPNPANSDGETLTVRERREKRGVS